MVVKNWKVLSWNVHGINSDKKGNAIRDRVSESCCDVICLQETKRSHFDDMYIRQFCPSIYDYFEVLPSVGASGGSIIICKSSIFSCSLVFQNDFASSILFSSVHITQPGFLPIYMPHALLGKRISLTGSKIFRCLILLIG